MLTRLSGAAGPSRLVRQPRRLFWAELKQALWGEAPAAVPATHQASSLEERPARAWSSAPSSSAKGERQRRRRQRSRLERDGAPFYGPSPQLEPPCSDAVAGAPIGFPEGSKRTARPVDLSNIVSRMEAATSVRELLHHHALTCAPSTSASRGASVGGSGGLFVGAAAAAEPAPDDAAAAAAAESAIGSFWSCFGRLRASAAAEREWISANPAALQPAALQLHAHLPAISPHVLSIVSRNVCTLPRRAAPGSSQPWPAVWRKLCSRAAESRESLTADECARIAAAGARVGRITPHQVAKLTGSAVGRFEQLSTECVRSLVRACAMCSFHSRGTFEQARRHICSHICSHICNHICNHLCNHICTPSDDATTFLERRHPLT